MKKTKTLKQQAAESLNRRAGQYERHGRPGAADNLREAVMMLLGKRADRNNRTWEKEDE